ncbi:MAG TPA: right-handed parallel beta-helix repeat-containing protein [Candidatus Brocadiia bacterium]|nr:right-handed parallel beta-helix repeat-containing protein [Candidatus Brocadiia bacterium]
MIIVDTALRERSATAGIQEALDALPAQGGMVLIPAGTYTLRQSVRLRPNTRLCGEGPATVLTRPAPVWGRLLEPVIKGQTSVRMENASALQPGDQLLLRDFTQGGWHSRYLVVRQVKGGAVEGEIIYGDLERSYLLENEPWAGTHFPALWAHQVNDVTIESLTIDGGPHAYDPARIGDFVCSAVHCRDVMRLRVKDLTIRRWPSDGVGAQGGSALVTGCVVEDCLGSGLHPGTCIGQSVWTGNMCRGNWKGLLFCARVCNTIVANNVFLANKEHGIWGLGDPDKHNVVSANVCSDNGWYGIEGFKAWGNAITGNVCRGNSQAAPGVYSGIHLEQHRDNLVAGNVCVDDKDRPTQTRGITAINPIGPNVIGDNHAVEGSAYMSTWVAQEQAHAAFEARKKARGGAG